MSAECNVCAAHSGQDEKIKGVGRQLGVLIWMLGILTAVIIGVGGALWSQLSSLSVSVATFTSRTAAFEARLEKLESRQDRLEQRQ